jgi:hypothetical protein
MKKMLLINPLNVQIAACVIEKLELVNALLDSKGQLANEVMTISTHSPSLTSLVPVSCNSQCSGHGRCMTISKIYDFYTIGSTPSGYDKWDGQIAGCVCDYGTSPF